MIETASRWSRTWKGKILIFLFIWLGYLALGWISLKLATINDNASPIWPPAGFAIGCMILFGRRYAPAVFLGAMMTNATVNAELVSPYIIGLGNMLESICGAYFVSLILRKNILKSYSEFYAITFAAIFTTMVSSTIGTACLYFSGIIPLTEINYCWYTWWSGDAIGVMIVLPFFLELRFLGNLQTITFSKICRGIAVLLLLSLISYLVFVKSFSLAFAWSLTPVLIWAGMSLGHLISRTILILLALFIVMLTAMGFSPYDYGNMNLNLIYVQSLLTSYAFAILFIRPFDTGFKISSRFIWGNIAAWAGLFLIIFMTFKYERRFTRQDLERSVSAAMESVSQSTSHIDLLMKSASSLVSQNPDITETEWSEFVESIRIDLRHKELNSLGVLIPSLKSDTDKFLQKARSRSSLITGVRQINPEFAKKFPDQFLVTFAEPKLNNYFIGWDLASESLRRTAAEKARDLNQAIATPSLKLIRGTTEGFLIFQPIYTGKDKFQGWIYTTTDLSVFFGRSLQDFGHVLRTKIYEETKLVYNMDRYPKDIYTNHSYKILKHISIFGNNYSLEFYPTAQFFKRHSGYSAILALLMNLFMLFITGFLLEQITFSLRAENLVHERTRQLEESKSQLINSSKMASLGEMASGMAHEINNPLTIILGKIKMISMMMEESSIDHPVILEEMSRMRVTTERIGKIVKGLRSFSRASEHDEFEKVPANLIVQETLDLCLEKFKAKGIDVKVSLIPDILVNCRPSQISQVFLNLLNNAYDALGASTEHRNWIRMDFSLRTASILEISISDSGKGIDAEILDKIMEPFFTTKEVGKGTGLGLSIAKGIIEDHGGRIWLDTQSLNTRFVIELPYQRG